MAAGLLLWLTACAPEPTPPPPAEVVVEPAAERTFQIYGSYVAITHPSQNVEVRARVNGFVQSVEFTEGSYVEEGALLYRIDDRPYSAAVARAEATLERIRTQLAKAERDVERLRPLYEDNAASQLDLDNAESARDQATADVAAAQADLVEARLELEFTRITAPITGVVGQTEVHQGALVGNEGKSLLTTVKRVDPMFVEFRMSALDYLNAQRRKSRWEARQDQEEGSAVEGWVRLTLPDDSDYRFGGDISFTDPQVNPDTGTFAVRAVVRNPDRELLPGQYTRARIELEEIPGAVVVPEKSLRVEQGGSYLMVVMPDDTVERRFLVLGPSRDGQTVVKSGLDAGERVIVEGMQRVRHGQRVVPLSVEDYEQRREAREKAAANPAANADTSG